MEVMAEKSVVVLGAGVAGLGASYELSKAGIPVTVFEKESQVGGLCRTIEFEGSFFDLGGHRFLSKNAEVNALWKKILGSDLLTVRRQSRIYYRDRFFQYPLKPFEALISLGPFEACRCMASYLSSKIHGAKKISEKSFEDWMIERFGKRLYEVFFKEYTEKVWGIPCSDLSSDWAVQRIQSLSLRRALGKAFFGRFSAKNPKSLSEEFYYPAKGPGLFCERLKDESQKACGAVFCLNSEIEQLSVKQNRIVEIAARSSTGQKIVTNNFDHVISSLPLPVLIEKISPTPPVAVLEAARMLKFRGFMSVNLIFKDRNRLKDHWIYLQSGKTRAGRVQIFNNWSAGMVFDPNDMALGVEYFVNEGDDLWKKTDHELIDVALSELELVRLADRRHFKTGCVVRANYAYPIYRCGYRQKLQIVREYISKVTNLQLIGRSGLFRYDNSDHALLTGLGAARNYLGSSHEDLWKINTEEEFHEDLEV